MVSPWGVSPLDCVRKRFSGFYRFYGFNGGGAAHKNIEAPRRFETRETLIKSLSDFTLEFLCTARNNLTRIASYLRKVMTKLCIKILVKSDSAI